MPYITQVAIGKLPFLNIFGNDYPTKDGTGIRDYIHVTDLAKGHVAALKNIFNIGYIAINLGTGKGYSVYDIINEMKIVIGKDIPIKIMPRRDGDVSSLYANVNKAKTILKWESHFTLKDMCEDAWKWQKNNFDNH